MLVVIDIDGTIADGTERFKKAGPEPDRANTQEYLDWVEKVNTGIEGDSPVRGMALTVHALVVRAKVLYLTSREEKLRTATHNWLYRHSFPTTPPIFMRPNNCWMGAAELKEIAIQLHRQGDSEVVVIDDDEKGTIEAMCKKNGWTFLKARSGGQK